MGNSKSKLKTGMSGSNGGKGRWEYTEVLKRDSKKRRRVADKNDCEKELSLVKGVDLCNRTACQTDKGVFMWNETMRAFYCFKCARLINDGAGELGPLCVEDKARKLEYDTKRMNRNSRYGKYSEIFSV